MVAFDRTGLTSVAAGENGRPEHGLVGAGTPRSDRRRCRTKVGAVEIETNALAQAGDIFLAKTGIGAGCAGLRAIKAGLDTPKQVEIDVAVQGGVGADHCFGMHGNLQSGLMIHSSVKAGVDIDNK